MIALTQGSTVDQHKTFVTGQAPFRLAATRVSTWKYNDDGTVAWQRTWPDIPVGPTYGVAAVSDGGDGVIVTGAYTKTGEGVNIVVLYYNGAGVLQPGFPYIYNNAAQNGDDVPVAMDFDQANGAVWIAGKSVGVGTGDDIVVLGLPVGPNPVLLTTVAIKYNHTSNMADVPAAIKALPVLSGGGGAGGGGGSSTLGVFVAGTSFDSTTEDDIVALEYNVQPNGSYTNPWSRRYTGAGGATDESAVDLEIDAGIEAVGVYVAGNRTLVDGTHDFVTLGYPRTTNAPDPWSMVYDNGGDDVAVKIGLAFMNGWLTKRVFVGGSSVGNNSTYDMAVVAYDAPSGVPSENWDIQPYRSSLPAEDRMVDMVVVDENHIYIAGRWFNAVDFDYRVQKINLDSPTPAWQSDAVYNIGSNQSDFPAALAFRPTLTPPFPGGEVEYGNFYITGRNTTLTETGPRYATVKFIQNPPN